MILLNCCNCAWELPWHIGLMEKVWRWALQALGAGEVVRALRGCKKNQAGTMAWWLWGRDKYHISQCGAVIAGKLRTEINTAPSPCWCWAVIPGWHRNGWKQSRICSVAQMIKEALMLILSPVPDFLSRFYKLLFVEKPSLSWYHLSAWHEHRCCRQKLAKNWHQIWCFASLLCLHSPKEQI